MYECNVFMTLEIIGLYDGLFGGTMTDLAIDRFTRKKGGVPGRRGPDEARVAFEAARAGLCRRSDCLKSWCWAARAVGPERRVAGAGKY